MKLNELTLAQAREKLDKKEISALDLTKACLERIKEVDSKLKACINVFEEEAIEKAQEADQKLAKGERYDLLGIPYLAKDIFLTKGFKTTAGSKMLENYQAPFNATVIEKLEAQGAILLGKTNMDEFAHGASTENSAFFKTLNPWDKDRVPGGSSGGSAAAVSADMCIFALGSDTGGSVRQPASFCSVCGIKPTYSRISRFGLISMTSSTDVVGALTKTVEDSSIVLKNISGKDEKDASSSNKEVLDYSKNIEKSLQGKTIGIAQEYFSDDLNEDVKKNIEQAIEVFKSLGAEVKNISLPYNKYSIPVYYIITPSEISSNLARFDGLRYGFSEQEAKDFKEAYSKNRGEGFGPEVKRRIMLGTYTLSAGYYDAYYLKAQKVRTKIREDFAKAFKEVDILLTPTSPHVPFKFGANKSPLDMYLEDVFSTGPSLAGLPAISIPAGFIDNLPLGLQLIADKFQEDTLYNFAYKYQENTNWHKNKPKI